jgi:C-terminal processing protease CtpA/Prc
MESDTMSKRRFRGAALVLGLVSLGLAVPAAAQERPLGEETARARSDSMHGQHAEIERHREEMERHRAEMERHARAMSEALSRAYRDSTGEMTMYRRDDAFGPDGRFLYRTRMRTPCARMGIAFSGEDTIRVEEVMPNSGAAEAGVRAGDVILTVNGEPASARTMIELGEEMEPGDRLRLVVRRNGAQQTLDVTAREDICPYRTMLSGAPFRITCLKTDSASAEADPECDHEWVFDMREELSQLHQHMPLRMFSEEGDSGVWLRFFGPNGPGDSLFIDLDSVRMMSEAIVLQLDSLRQLMPLRFEYADSLRMMMPKIQMELHAADEALNAHGLMLRSMELGARALAGAQITDLNEDLAQYFEADHGVLVTLVEDGTPAARAGLRGGDVIVSVDGHDVSDVGDVRRYAAEADGPIDLSILRAGERRTIRLAD